MSEDEQSWSYSELHRAHKLGTLLVCAMAEVRPDARWPMDSRDFAQAVDTMAAKGNRVAKGIHVFDGPAGRSCHDFNQALSSALSATFIEYLSPSYTEMLLNVSPRTIGHFLRRHVISEETLEEAKALVREFWYITRGGRPEEPKGAES
jgi:hypothetical protein